jgi:hypothetical protein
MNALGPAAPGPQLPDKILSFILECSGLTDFSKVPHIHQILTLYAHRQVDRKQAAVALEGTVGSTDLLKKLDEALHPQPMAPPLTLRQLIPPGKRHRPNRWTPEEDERLVAAIQLHGTENWPLIAAFVGGGRTRSQCAQRWHRGLDPKLLKCNWTREEEQRLLDAVRDHGDKAWTRVAGDLGNRSDVQCRFRYRFLCKKAREMNADVRPISAPKAAVPAPDGDPAQPLAAQQTFVNEAPGK